jgi:hypothetical protein
MKRRDEHSGPMHRVRILPVRERATDTCSTIAAGQIATNVLIAWNCSTEQARATALAMPIYQKADRVTILTVITERECRAPAEQLIDICGKWGCRESMRVELMGEPVRDPGTPNHWAATLNQGCYTQSRLVDIWRQPNTSGECSLPVLLAN